MNQTLENDWLLKTAIFACSALRYLLLLFAFLAGIIGAIAGLLLIVQLAAPDWVSSLPGAAPVQVHEAAGLSVLMITLAAALWLSSVFFQRLVEIGRTVGEGDPFARANADRLFQMGLISLALFSMSVAAVIGAMIYASKFDEIAADLTLDVSIESLMMAAILFILARVFRHGAAMREDLEGTV